MAVGRYNLNLVAAEVVAAAFHWGHQGQHQRSIQRRMSLLSSAQRPRCIEFARML
jgi:hypothetical protein